MSPEQAIEKLTRLANELEEILESSEDLFHSPELFKANLGIAINSLEIGIEQLEEGLEEDA